MSTEYEKRSGLSDDELYSLWAKFSEEEPKLFKLYFDTIYQRNTSDEQLRANEIGINFFIQREFPRLSIYPQRHYIYSDMIHFLTDTRVKNLGPIYLLDPRRRKVHKGV